MKKNLKEIIDFLPGITLLLLFYANVSLYSFHDFFNIPIYNYVNGSEVLTSILPFILNVVNVSVVWVLIGIHATISIMLEKPKLSLAPPDTLYNNILNFTVRPKDLKGTLGFVVCILILWGLAIYLQFDFPIFFLFSGWGMPLIALSGLLLLKKEIVINFKTLIFFAFLLILQKPVTNHAYYKAFSIIRAEDSSYITFSKEGKRFHPSDTSRLISETQSFIFIYNRFDSVSYVFNKEGLDSISYKQIIFRPKKHRPDRRPWVAG